MITSGKQILLTLLLAQAVPGHASRIKPSFVTMDLSVTGGCTDKANAGEWDNDCYRSVTSGHSYQKKYCAYFKAQISTTGAAGVSKHCAETSDSYCLALAEAGIYFGHCHSHYGGDRKRDAKGYMDALCDVSGHGSVSEALSARTCGGRGVSDCQKTIKTRCMKDGPLGFCAAIKSEGTYEHECVLRIEHRGDDDEYCTCSILGGGHWDGKLLRCNERQDPNNEMDRWDNQCLRWCSGYPNNKHLGWYCTPVKKYAVSYSTAAYSGSLRKFGEWEHATEIVGKIVKQQEEKRGGLKPTL